MKTPCNLHRRMSCPTGREAIERVEQLNKWLEAQLDQDNYNMADVVFQAVPELEKELNASITYLHEVQKAIRTIKYCERALEELAVMMNKPL